MYLRLFAVVFGAATTSPQHALIFQHIVFVFLFYFIVSLWERHSWLATVVFVFCWPVVSSSCLWYYLWVLAGCRLSLCCTCPLICFLLPTQRRFFLCCPLTVCYNLFWTYFAFFFSFQLFSLEKNIFFAQTTLFGCHLRCCAPTLSAVW